MTRQKSHAFDSEKVGRYNLVIYFIICAVPEKILEGHWKFLGGGGGGEGGLRSPNFISKV